jgi:3D (Asp-Asp-Asp) domain-containing protein|tara:strand:- start:176 stop:766 length:591 start_codon:yes stop_codon:yes gene_type:complete
LGSVFAFSFVFAFPQVSLAAQENYVSLSRGEGLKYYHTVLGPEKYANSIENIYERDEKFIPVPQPEEEREYLPLEGPPRVVSEHWITVTAYSSEPRQTDSTPFTTAWQTPVRDGVVAINFLPKGAMVRFPDKYGDKIFVVEDRMNVRYQYRADIWMYTRAEAKQFGLKYLRMEVLSTKLPRDYVLTNYKAAFPGMK